MNYHIMIDDKFIDGFITDSENVSVKDANRYFIRGRRENAVYVKHPQAVWVGDIWSRDFRKILQAVTDQDKIFVHWYDLYVGRLMLTLDKNIPLYVAFWGGEFYSDPFLYHIHWLYDPLTLDYIKKAYIFPGVWPKNPVKILRHLWWLLNHKHIIQAEFNLKKSTVRRINYLLLDPNIFSADYDRIKNIYGLSELRGLPFVYDQNFDLANKARVAGVRSGELKVQVGNSASESNNHADGLMALQKFSQEDIRIILPLSYGSKKYAAFVKKHCLNIFSGKCEFLEKFLARPEYIQKLQGIDVAVMFHNTSEAFGNCITLLTLGKKLYLKSNNPFWQLFQRAGVIVADANTIPDLSFAEFSRPLTEEQVRSNVEKISALFSEQKRLADLRRILND